MILAGGGLDLSNSYVLIIAASVIVILSYFFNKVSERTNVPSVLLLILTGILIKLGLDQMHFEIKGIKQSLEILGIVGLIMIVLEAALDLHISKDKLPLIKKTIIIALLGLILSSGIIVAIFKFMSPEMAMPQAILYAVPLGIMSSAIIIPSVTNLSEYKKEFMIYESAFSDIFGIMLFYFCVSFAEFGIGKASKDFVFGLIMTILVALVATYALIYIFRDLKGNVKLFLLIAVLLLLYSVGKLMHLSPLIIILVFGMALANHKPLFSLIKNPLSVNQDAIHKIEKEFHLITVETAFVVRTFFFIAFGLNIDLASLFNVEVLLVSILVTSGIYIFRYIVLYFFNRPNISPELNIAPRGLITILLFYAIPEQFGFPSFEPGVILYVIIITSIVMTYGLIKYSPKHAPGENVHTIGHHEI